MNSATRNTATKGMNLHPKPSNGRMGSSTSNRKGVLVIDEEGNESFRSKPQSLEDCLVRISDNCKGKSGKEEALVSIVKALTMEVKLQFVSKNFATLLYHCLFCIKKGKGSSLKELDLAAKLIGLMGMIVEDGDSAHEIYKDSVSVLFHVLETISKNTNLKILLDCLAIVTFFGTYGTDESQEVMGILWRFIEAKKHSSSDLLAVAISAWSFLLSSIEVWNINHKDWQGSISFLLCILESESDFSVCVAAAEALALIFENNCLEKFSTEEEAKDILKGKITEKLRSKVSEDGTENKTQIIIIDIVEYLESGNSLKTVAKIGKDKLVLSTWCQVIQMNFMKNFLGEEGFVRHMRLNENLQAIFEFTPKKKSNTSNIGSSPEREEVKLSFFHPKVETKDDGSLLPFVTKEAKQSLDKMNGRGPNSFLKKARTCLLNKKRMLSQREKYQFHND